MDNSILDRVRQIAADVFGIQIEQVTPQSSRDSIETWDSLEHLNFVLALEQSFSIQLDPEEIEQMLSVELVCIIIEEKLRQHSTAKL